MGKPEDYVHIGHGVSMPVGALRCQPSMQWRHIDGPLMNWGGRLHWLTWRERFALWLGRTTLRDIAIGQWPEAQFWIPTNLDGEDAP